ncbi:hypothetical protein [Enterococcus sp. RIT-PI-f]|uniref:hypothetical protein n=1 Tax=Enterococcus sp. RIT-PI-f TaxID=1690244 RepID=UPI001F22643B|nr:hypothetical protein [Enterococcus sp. RIT-PI-f]
MRRIRDDQQSNDENKKSQPVDMHFNKTTDKQKKKDTGKQRFIFYDVWFQHHKNT